jgi:glycine betaine/proline transport system substrate-binding protein
MLGRLKFTLGALVAVMLLVVVAGCSEEEVVVPKATIVFSDQQFESIWINNAIAKFIIEKGYGNPVETIEMSTPIMQASLSSGDIDVNLELWQQNIIDWYNEGIAAGDFENGGETYEGGPQFFAVPTYFAEEHNIVTIEDMKKPEVVAALANPENPSKGAFNNCIIGWQCAEINRAKLQSYGLVPEYYDIISLGASAAMEAALAGPQKKGEPVFGYYWAPTALMGMYKWTIIEEPEYNAECWADVIKGRDDATYTPAEACAYETLPIDKGLHKGLKVKAPDIYEMLKKMNVGLQPINETAAWAKSNDIEGEWERAAIYYLDNNADRWHTWVTNEVKLKLIGYLNTNAAS